MKRKYSVGYFIFMAILVGGLSFIYAYTGNKENEINLYAEADEIEEEDSINSNSNVILSEGYILRQRGDYVVVYLYDNETLFEETSILMSSLDEELQREIEEGKYIETTKELYGFLENYSS